MPKFIIPNQCADIWVSFDIASEVAINYIGALPGVDGAIAYRN